MARSDALSSLINTSRWGQRNGHHLPLRLPRQNATRAGFHNHLITSLQVYVIGDQASNWHPSSSWHTADGPSLAKFWQASCVPREAFHTRVCVCGRPPVCRNLRPGCVRSGSSSNLSAGAWWGVVLCSAWDRCLASLIAVDSCTGFSSCVALCNPNIVWLVCNSLP